jgi:hypothetical protein
MEKDIRTQNIMNSRKRERLCRVKNMVIALLQIFFDGLDLSFTSAVHRFLSVT